MKLILLRHGNTFAAGQTPVWLGRNQDPPLVQSGVEQAVAVGRALRAGAPRVTEVYASPLRRAREFAEHVCTESGVAASLTIDPLLHELDYGAWAGLSDAEVLQKFGAAELEAWQKHSTWPTAAGFSPAQQIVRKETQDFVDRFKAYPPEAVVLAVSSNGRLRYFLSSVPGEFERRTATGGFKVSTGRACVLNIVQDGPSLLGWNLSPKELAECLG